MIYLTRDPDSQHRIEWQGTAWFTQKKQNDIRKSGWQGIKDLKQKRETRNYHQPNYNADQVTIQLYNIQY